MGSPPKKSKFSAAIGRGPPFFDQSRDQPRHRLSGRIIARSPFQKKTKIAPDRRILLLQGRTKRAFYPRCHLDSRPVPCAFGYRHIRGSNACPCVAEYSESDPPSFDCTLRGPFADLFLARFSASRALCEGIIDVISASTVYVSIARVSPFVKGFFDFLIWIFMHITPMVLCGAE